MGLSTFVSEYIFIFLLGMTSFFSVSKRLILIIAITNFSMMLSQSPFGNFFLFFFHYKLTSDITTYHSGF